MVLRLRILTYSTCVCTNALHCPFLPSYNNNVHLGPIDSMKRNVGFKKEIFSMSRTVHVRNLFNLKIMC